MQPLQLPATSSFQTHLVRRRTDGACRIAQSAHVNPTAAELFDFSSERVSNAPARRCAIIASDLLPPFDLVCVFLAAAISSAMYTRGFVDADASELFARASIVVAVLATFILYDRHFGTRVSRGNTRDFIRPFAKRFAAFAAVALLLGVATQTIDRFPPGCLALWLVASLLLTLLSRALVGKALRMLQRRGTDTASVAIVGAGPLADQLIVELRQQRPNAFELLGVFDDRHARAEHLRTAPVGDLSCLIEIGKSRRIDWILLALPSLAEHRLIAIVQRLDTLSVPIGLASQHVAALPQRGVDFAAGSVPVILLADRPIKRWDALIKAVEDFVLGAIFAVALLPLFAIIALAIKLDSPGPVIFTQPRHAQNNREFRIFKFRTMRWTSPGDAAHFQQTTRQDARVTRIGRFLRASSLDELPQLFNVLLGQMSLVGPRPHAVDMRTEDQLGVDITERYEHRHRVKPGMTGWSQVNGARGATETKAQLKRRVELDLQYIDNWSLLLDLKILAMTARQLLKHTDAY